MNEPQPRALSPMARAILSAQTPPPPEIIVPGNVPRNPDPEQNPPRFAICVPSCDQVNANFAQALAALTYSMGLYRLPTVLVNTKGSNIARNRNNLVERALMLQADFIVFIDSDMAFPSDAIVRLWKHGKDIVGAAYASRQPPHRNLAVPLNKQVVEKAEGVLEVDALPTGLLMIAAPVFATLKRPYFRYTCVEEDEAANVLPMIGGEDYNFCDRARAAGHSIWLDVELSHQVLHFGEVGVRLTETPEGRTEQNQGWELLEQQA